MTINDTRFGPQDTPQGKQVGTSTDRQVGHEPDHPAAQQGPGHGGHAGHYWMMMMIMCAPMLVIAVALVATGTAGFGTIVVALGCTVMMAMMMRGGGHGRGGGA